MAKWMFWSILSFKNWENFFFRKSGPQVFQTTSSKNRLIKDLSERMATKYIGLSNLISFYSSINDHWLQTQNARMGFIFKKVFFGSKHSVKILNFKWMQIIFTVSILSLTPNNILDCIFFKFTARYMRL